MRLRWNRYLFFFSLSFGSVGIYFAGRFIQLSCFVKWHKGVLASRERERREKQKLGGLNE